jgi:hypothetical protein
MLFIMEHMGGLRQYILQKKSHPILRPGGFVKVPQGGRRWKRGVAVVTDKNWFNSLV